MKRSTCSRSALRDGSIAYTFRGSEFGMCAHRHVASLRGMVEAAVDWKTRKMFDAGNAGEEVAKKLLIDLAKKDPRLKVEEYASGYQNQTSVSLIEKRSGFPDGIDREMRLICSPDGRLSGSSLVEVFNAAGWLTGYERGDVQPEDWSLEVKCYGESSKKKFKTKGAASNPTLEWQTSGVTAGFEERIGRPHGVVVMVLTREEVKDADGNLVDYSVPEDQTPMIWVYDRPKYTGAECLQRCWDIANIYERGEWPKCDNAFFCRFPHRATPVIDPIAEDMLATLAETWERFNAALRDAEGLLIGVQNGEQVHGYTLCRQLLSVPTVRLR